MTNGDKIRQMSNEELVELFNDKCKCCKFNFFSKDCEENTCITGIKAYLDMEIQE